MITALVSLERRSLRRRSFLRRLASALPGLTIGVAFGVLVVACAPDPAQTVERFEAATRAFAAQDLPAASAAANVVLDLDPDHTNARILRGRIAYFEKNYPAAEVDFRVAAERDPASVDARLWLARAQSRQATPAGPDAGDSDASDAGDAATAGSNSGTDAAIQTLEALVADDPGNPSAWYLLGSLYESRGQVDRGIAAYRYGLVAGQNLGLIHLRLARLYADAGLPEQARPHLAAAAVFARFDGDNADLARRVEVLRATLAK